jgi:excisionase family DNA binding protein
MKTNPLLLAVMLAVVTAPPDMTIEDVARYLGVTTKTVRTMIADKRLRAYKLGDRVIRFRRTDVDAAMTAIGGAV